MREWVSERNIVMMDECFWINAPQWWKKKKEKEKKKRKEKDSREAS